MVVAGPAEPLPLRPLAGTLFGQGRESVLRLLAPHVDVLQRISRMGHQESAGFLLDAFELLPDHVRLLLLKEHLDEPRVRASVEMLAGDESNPALQVAATGMLRDLSAN